jgi:hypothetical protein
MSNRNPKIENLKPYKKGQSGNPFGRPRKLLSSLSEIGYSNSQISDALLNIIALTEQELKTIVENEECTILERLVAKSILKDYAKGSLWNLETIITRAIGKPKETAQITNDGTINVVFQKGKTIL